MRKKELVMNQNERDVKIILLQSIVLLLTIILSLSGTAMAAGTIAFATDDHAYLGTSTAVLAGDFNQIIPQSPTGQVDAVLMLGDDNRINSGSHSTEGAFLDSTARNIPRFYIPGNHDMDSSTNGGDLGVIKSFFASYAYSPNPGPDGSRNTTFSFDVGEIHVVMLNEYWDGNNNSNCDWFKPSSGLNADDGCYKYDSSDGGFIPDPLFTWLENDLNNNDKPAIVVVGHEQLYPYGLMVGGSLDKNITNRNRLQNIFITQNVTAFIGGHSHRAIIQSFDGIFHAGAGVIGDNVGSLGADNFATITYVTVDENGFFNITQKSENPNWNSVRTVTYSTFLEASGKPTFSPPAGTYSYPQAVSISTSLSGATIHYTSDGTTPDESSQIYTVPIIISTTTTIKSGAWKPGFDPSPVADATYTFYSPVLTSILVAPQSAVLLPGNTQQFYATPQDQYGNPVTADIIWESSNTTVGTINSQGMFSALSKGTTTITASNGSINDTATVTVIPSYPPTAYWRFDENDGNTASDSSGNGYTGTINGATWASGKYGSALNFDGVNDYVNIPDPNDLAGVNAITISAWIKSDIPSLGDYAGIVTKYERNVGGAYSLGTRTGAGIAATIYAESSHLSITTPLRWTGYSDMAWHNIALTFNDSNLRLYVDGILYSEETGINAIINSDTRDIYIAECLELELVISMVQ